jgi:uncharacterized membrane protein
MEARDLPNRLAEALRTAQAITAQDPQSEIHIFTDGAVSSELVSEFAGNRFRWVGVGRKGRNIGITHLAVRKIPYGLSSYQAFLSVVNFSESSESFTFALTLDDRPIVEKSLKLEPKVRRSLILPFSHHGGGLIRVQLKVKDDLEADDVAHAVIPPPRQMQVLLVSSGNLFLENALRVDPQVKLEVKTPEAYKGGMESFDVAVLDNVSPTQIGPGRFVLINTAPSDVSLETLGRIEQPVIMDWDRTHPIMRHIDFSKVAIEEALRIRPMGAGKILVEAVGGPLIYALEEPKRKVVFIGFDLFKTDFPLRVVFPMVLSNALRWLDPAGIDESSLQREAGQLFLLPVEHGVTTAAVITPSGRRLKAEVARGVASFSETDRVGIYSVITLKGKSQVAVNLMDEAESDLTPRPLPPIAGNANENQAVSVEKEIWPALIFLALALLLIEGMLYWRRQSGGNVTLALDARDRWVLGLRSGLLLVLAVSLFRPQIPRWVDRLNVIFLVDVSESVSAGSQAEARRYVAEAFTGMRERDQAGVIAFGQGARVEKQLGTDTRWDRSESSVPAKGTNIAQAIELAVATLPSGEANRVVLLSDGRSNAGHAVSAAQSARDTGVDMYYVPLPLKFPREVAVESLALPREVKFGEPFDARVVAWSQGETPGRLSLFRDGEFLGSQTVALSVGKNVFTYRQALEQSGIHVYQVSVEVEGDAIEENNRAVATVAVRGRPQVLVAEKDRSHAQALASALGAQHIDVHVVTAESIPASLAGFQKYDAVILSNIPALKMTKKQMESIRDYVKDYGGGLIMVGGEESFGLGGYYRTPVEEALPVTMDVKQKVQIPSLSVVLSIDRSGSMTLPTSGKVTKLDIAKEAAQLVVELLDKENEVGVMSWDTEFVWDVPIQQVWNKSEVSHAIATIKPGGGTEGYPALKEAYEALFNRQALLKHVIFLSDGQMARREFGSLVPRMAEDKITVSSVAIGRDSDVQLMQDIARWGRGAYYYTEDVHAIPRIFAQEAERASKSSLVEQPFKARVRNPSHEILQGINWDRVPPLGGYVATTPKGNAETLLLTHRDEPLLEVWRYGLGRAVAFTSDAKPKWGVDWLRWRDFNKFWAQVVRWTLRTGSRSDTVAFVERRDGAGEVTVEAISSRGDFINFLDTEVGVVSPDRQRQVVGLEQVGPGRYRGRFLARQEGVYLVGMAQRRGNRMLGSQLVSLVVPYSQEFRDLGVDESALSEMVELTGGGRLSQPRDAFLHARRRSQLWADLWPWLVGLAAAMLLSDLALRRVGLGLPGRILSRLRGGQVGV